MTVLYPYQIEGVKKLVILGRGLLADEPGLGKSVQSLYAARELDAFPCIVICPASLKVNWKRETLKHLGISANVLSGESPAPKRTKVHDVTVVNYDVLGPRMEELLRLNAKCVIPDEAHYLQNRSAKRTKFSKMLCKKAEYCFALTGTPITNRPSDLWALLNVLRADLFPSFMAFCKQFARPKKNPWGWSYDGAKNLPELHALLRKELMIRRLKSDVLKDLPPKRRIVVPLELKNRNQYEGAKKDFFGWLTKNNPEKLSGAERARGLSMANHLKQLVGKLKMPSVIEWAQNHLEESGGKLLLFAHHRAVIEGLHESFDGAVKVYGGLSDKKRQLAFDSFNSDPEIPVLAGQIESAGQGWSCVGTSTCAFAEIDWRASLIDQACERAHGVGRGVEGEGSESWFLLAENTIEEALARAIERKQKIARAALDGGEGEVTAIFTEFCRALREGG